MTSYKDILQFWFEAIDASMHWAKNTDFDNQVRQKFAAVHAAGMQGELAAWRDSAAGRLAEIIVLDQFPRNMYRDTAKAFVSDALALVLAQEAVRQQAHLEIEQECASFMLMPYMHSESRLIHTEAVVLFDQPYLADAYAFELKHKAIIDRFGRYPHRNKILGRASTVEELAFLAQPGSSF